MKKWIFILFSLVFVACEKNEPVRYRQFTSDDLSYLYFNKDTLTYTGVKIIYRDTLIYLLNDTDSIHVTITTDIHSSLNPWSIINIEDIYGSSLMVFGKNTGFEFANIRVYRTGDSGNATKDFQVSAYGINAFNKQYFGAQTDTVHLDTVLLHGKLYQNVYKFYPPEDGKTDIRLIYFAKKYGYIKIEKLDGTKIELINNGK